MPVEHLAKSVHAGEFSSPPWASEQPLPRIGHAYSWPREAAVFWNKVIGPTRRHHALTEFVAQHRHYCDVAPQLRLAFLGDLLPLGGKACRLGNGLRRFLENADYLVINLEGVIAGRSRVINAVRHAPSIVPFLAELFPPERTVLLTGNNHAADCGYLAFDRHCRDLEQRGFRVVGRREEPSIMLPGNIQLANGTEWSNVRHGYVARLADAALSWREDANFRVYCPHWGHEMELYPTPAQINRARGLASQWDMMVGHHPHCPQPIVELDGCLVAFSLGNFAWGAATERYSYGAALLATVGPNASGRWRIGEMQWMFTKQTTHTEGSLLLDTAPTCRFFNQVGR